MRVFAFLASGILYDGAVPFFHMNSYGFLDRNCFFNESVCFFGLRHFVRRCCAVFSYEFVVFLRPELFFQWECLLFWPQAFCKTVQCRFFHMSL